MKKIILLFLFLIKLESNSYAQSIEKVVDSVYNGTLPNLEAKINFSEGIKKSMIKELMDLSFTQNGKYQFVTSSILLAYLKNAKDNETKSFLINELLNFCISDSLKYCIACESISKELWEFEVKYFNNSSIGKLQKILSNIKLIESFDGDKIYYPNGSTVLLAGMLNDKNLTVLIEKLQTRKEYKYKYETHLALARAGVQSSIDTCFKRLYPKISNKLNFVGNIDIKYISYIRNKKCLPFYEIALFDENAYNQEPNFPGYKLYNKALFYFRKDIKNFPFIDDININDYGGNSVPDPYMVKVRKWYNENKDKLEFDNSKF